MKKIKYSEERDAETGYSYFGARYMDHELMTTWLSVDPMAEKYPNISPYSYCAWNPVILVDPDGRELYEWQFDVQTREMTKVGNGGGATHQTVSVVYPDGSSFVVEGNGQDIIIQSACMVFVWVYLRQRLLQDLLVPQVQQPHSSQSVL